MSDYEVVLSFDESDDDPRYSIVPEISGDAPADHTVILIDPACGVALDETGFPTLEGLEAWHREHNSHLFND